MEGENWNEQIFNLPSNHGWTARPGNKVVVLDRGALRFEIPRGWIVEPSRSSLKLMDDEIADATMSLEVSVIYAGVRGRKVNWAGLPLGELIKNVTAERQPGFSSRRKGKKRKQDETKVGPPTAIKLGNLEMAWVQTEFIDPGENRPAHSRIAVTRDPDASIHGLFTFSFWPEDIERAKGVWNDVLGTLKMGERYESPFRGPGAGGAQKL